jgi:hypothetical protein
VMAGPVVRVVSTVAAIVMPPAAFA